MPSGRYPVAKPIALESTRVNEGRIQPPHPVSIIQDTAIRAAIDCSNTSNRSSNSSRKMGEGLRRRKKNEKKKEKKKEKKEKEEEASLSGEGEVGSFM